MDALNISQAALAGYDWGGRAACIVAALWPQRVKCLASQGGYNIQDISGSQEPRAPEMEYRAWYQYYFLAERGRKGLEKNRREFCRLLWRLWSPNWHFDDETYERSAKSFDNPDFVDVVIHSYRHRFGLVWGDPAVQDTEDRLAARPQISVPTIALDGGTSGVRGSRHPGGRSHFFTGKYEHHEIPLAGHNLPQEAPREFADSTLSLVSIWLALVASASASGDRPLLRRQRQIFARFRRLVSGQPSGGCELSDPIDREVCQARQYRTKIVANRDFYNSDGTALPPRLLRVGCCQCLLQ